MNKITIWTNDFGSVKLQVMDELKSGNAVRIGASCIGHTRAQMIENNTQTFMKSIGAKCEEGFWYLPKKEKEPKPKKRGRPKKVRL